LKPLSRRLLQLVSALVAASTLFAALTSLAIAQDIDYDPGAHIRTFIEHEFYRDTVPRPISVLTGATDLKVTDWPNDAGSTVCVTFSKMDWEDTGVIMNNGMQMTDLFYVIEWAETPEGLWEEADRFPVNTQFLNDDWGTFGFLPEGYNTTHYSQISYELETEGDEEATAEKTPIYIRVGLAAGESAMAGYYFPTIGSGTSKENYFHYAKKFNLVFIILIALVMMTFISKARKGMNLYIRRIAGLEAIDEAIGRATEMGRSMFYLCGLGFMSDVSTIAATNILGRVAFRVAEYESNLLVPSYDPIVMSVCQEVVKQAYTEAGRPDNYKEDNIFFLTQAQFSYVSAVNGMMVREKPAANFYFGYYFAESLLLAETGNQVGAIQIAGTDALVQIPFFISACDYTLIGEELYAASAYISREPKLLGSIKAIDMAKAVIILLIIFGTILGTLYAFDGPDKLQILSYIFAEQ
jgi:hypothetical protein